MTLENLWGDWSGVSLLNRFEEGAEQFRLDVAQNPNDTEESIWCFLCEAQLYGAIEARKRFLEVSCSLLKKEHHHCFYWNVKGLPELGPSTLILMTYLLTNQWIFLYAWDTVKYMYGVCVCICAKLIMWSITRHSKVGYIMI